MFHSSVTLEPCANAVHPVVHRAQLSDAEQQSIALKQQQEGAEDLVRFLRQELHNLRQDTIGVAAGTRQAISETEALQAGPPYPFAVDLKTFVTWDAALDSCCSAAAAKPSPRRKPFRQGFCTPFAVDLNNFVIFGFCPSTHCSKKLYT